MAWKAKPYPRMVPRASSTILMGLLMVVLLSAKARGPAVVDHVAQHLALPVVEDAVDFADRNDCRPAQFFSGDFESSVGRAEHRLVERRLAERARHVAARFAQRAAELARRVFELAERAHDRFLLARGRVEPRQDREEKAAPATERAAVAVAPCRRAEAGAVMPVAVGVGVKSTVVATPCHDPHEADEAERTEQQSEKHGVLLRPPS